MQTSPRAPITRPDQLSALASPVRQEIADVLSRMGPSSLAEIAGVLGRSEGAVRVLIHRGLRAVARDLGGRRW